MSFKDLDLHTNILKALKDAGYENPTPIQEKVIPEILAGHDICGMAQTGTGKTAAFLLPALEKLMVPSALKFNGGPRILILVPTRELAMQVANESVKYSKYLTKTKTVCIYGGAPYPVQNRELSRPYEILVATPGRLMDHMESKRINFSRLELFVLDEADRMLDMGFIKPVEEIAAAMPKERQTLMFSATLRSSVLNLSKTLLNKPKEISVTTDHAKHENIEQKIEYVKNITDKYETLDRLLEDESINQAIVFTSTKKQADQLQGILFEKGHQAAALHGDMNQHQRNRTITRVRQGNVRVLVATDVAARGIDVQTITHVINFDLPSNPEDYVHRIGRTGRAQAKGIAISLAAPRDYHLLRDIEKFTGQSLGAPKSEPSQKPMPRKSFGGKRPPPPWKRGGPRK